MASAAFLGPEWFLSSLLPKPSNPGTGETAPIAKPDPLALPPVKQEIRLLVDASGKTLASGLGRDDVEIPAMVELIEAFAKDTAKDQIEVVILPAAGVPYRDVVKLHEACERLGIGRVGVGVGAVGPVSTKP